jgi:hypothetical protein
MVHPNAERTKPRMTIVHEIDIFAKRKDPLGTGFTNINSAVPCSLSLATIPIFRNMSTNRQI